MLRLLAFAACIALPALAIAQSKPPAPQKKICRMLVPTGSILGKRVCLTDQEWKRFDAQNGEQTEQGLEGRRRGLPLDRP